MTPAEKAEYDRAYRARNKERIAQKKREYAQANYAQEQARVAAWVRANRARSNEIKQAWEVRNPEQVAAYYAAREPARAEYMKQYRKENPHVAREESKRRRVSHGQATPPWVDRRALDAIWVEARRLQMHVDHIIPLRGDNVCGLNVPWNLQLLTPEANRRKGNRYAA